VSSPEPVSRDQVEYERLVADHRAAFERLAYRLTGSRDDAQDLLQESLLDAYRFFHQFRQGTRFYHWVAQIMTRNHLDRFRRKRLPLVEWSGAEGEEESPVLTVAADREADPIQQILARELEDPYHSAIQSLLPAQQQTVQLCDLQGATYEEAAQAGGCPVGTIRSRLHRAHTALRAFLSGVSAVPSPETQRSHSRRAFLGYSAAAAAGAALNGVESAGATAGPVSVLLWMPRPESGGSHQERLAELLRAGGAGTVRCVTDASPASGLSGAALAEADVLVWWSGEAPSRLRPAVVQEAANRVRDGKLGLIVLERAEYCPVLTALFPPDTTWTSGPLRTPEEVQIRTTAPRHPIAAGVPPFSLAIGSAESAGTTLPAPELQVFEGVQPASGARGPEGVVWRPGRGRVFFFGPGRPGSALLEQGAGRTVLHNAIRWTAARPTPA